MEKTAIDLMFKEAQSSSAFKAEALALQVVSALWELMEKRGLSQAELAGRLDKKAAYVSRVLSGPHNLTLKTIAEFASALSADVGIQFCDEHSAAIANDELASIFNVEPPYRYLVDHTPSANDATYVFEDGDQQELSQPLAA